MIVLWELISYWNEDINLFRETVAEQDGLENSEYESCSASDYDTGPHENNPTIDDSEVACKWCGTLFDSQSRLKMHIYKKHWGGEFFEICLTKTPIGKPEFNRSYIITGITNNNFLMAGKCNFRCGFRWSFRYPFTILSLHIMDHLFSFFFTLFRIFSTDFNKL